MSSAGQQLVAGRIPSERIETTEVTSDSATFTTTQTVVISVVAPLVAGRTYMVRLVSRWNSDVSGDRVAVRIRQDDVNGSELTIDNVAIDAANLTAGWPFITEAEFTAPATESKTFVASASRVVGSGNCWLEANPTRPAYLYVSYIRG